MTYLATIMFPSHHLLRLMLAFSGMDFGLFVLNYLLGGKSPRIYVLYHRPGSVGLSLCSWYTMLLIH